MPTGRDAESQRARDAKRQRCRETEMPRAREQEKQRDSDAERQRCRESEAQRQSEKGRLSLHFHVSSSLLLPTLFLSTQPFPTLPFLPPPPILRRTLTFVPGDTPVTPSCQDGPLPPLRRPLIFVLRPIPLCKFGTSQNLQMTNQTKVLTAETKPRPTP